ncbi:MAG: thioredoxin domain-containing protein [Acidobacteria bacterium]|nr:thioredoxin domain-containing protein [Acidobacteriota bacterium]
MSNGKNNSKTPLIIIGLVLIVAVGGAWWFLGQSNAGIKNTNKPTNAKAGQTPIVTNIQGAQPPNMLGSANASVTVEEFADFQCPTCGVMHPKVKEVVSTYGSRIKFIFREYPLAIPAHDKAYEAAVAAEAAGLQGKFWDMQNLLFSNQQAWSANPDYRKVWEEYAAKIGLDVDRWKNDMAGLNAKARVDADLARGRALNVNSTPSIFINGIKLEFEQMTVETMRQMIDAELAKAPNASQPAPSAPAAGNSNTANVEPKKQ